MSPRRRDPERSTRVSRRQLGLAAFALLPGVSLLAAPLKPARLPELKGPPLLQDDIEHVAITSVDGLKVGHHTRADRPTGCTVILAEEGAVGGVAVRGAAPGTRDTELLRPENTIEAIHAVLLSGGSAFGLAAADGVMRFLRDRGIGLPTGGGPVPIVPGAVLYDLGVGGNSYPDADDGAAAAAAAAAASPEEGSVGAGAGATVGKILGMDRAMKGGIGTAGYRFDDGTVVAAIVAVNCRGDVRDPATGRIVAGARSEDGGFLNAERALLGGTDSAPNPAENTTIGLVATNRTLTKAQCNRLAGVAHDGLARAVVPAHTYYDGDTLFAMATGTQGPLEPSDNDRLDVAAAAAVVESILRAVRLASGVPGIPSVAELGTA